MTIIEAAASYVGVKWRHQGRTRDGLDCLGLIIVVAVDAGVPGAERFLAWDMRNYKRIPPNALAKELVNAGLIRSSQPVPGGVGLFAQPGTYPSHVGIFGHGELIHADASAGKVVRHGFVAPWPSMLRGCFIYPGVQ